MPGPDNNGVEPMDFEENENSGGGGGGGGHDDPFFLVENPTLDLESYINNYTGLAKLLRLIHIADHSPPLRLDALKMAISHVMTTYNVAMYQQLHKKLRDAVASNVGGGGNGGAGAAALLPQPLPDIAGGGGGGGENNNNGGENVANVNVAVAPHLPPGLPTLDMSWIEAKAKKGAMKMEKLDADLKNYKSNSIKESIRRGHDDLAEHYLDSGDLNNALKCFSRARDYCTSAKHVVNMCINVIKVSIYLQNWSHVINFVAKAESTPDVMEQGKGTAELVLKTKLKVAAGLADLAQKKYKSAAKFFLQANFDHCDFSDILSPNNVAVYGGLCALASFDREELKKHVISSSSFKLFLELEPQIRDVIFKFYDSKYDTCLRLLSEMRDNLLLDIFLAPHVRSLYGQIRSRGLIQYFSPYASADLNRMAACFNTTVPELENELMGLILEGQIEARIDSHNKVLYAKKTDQRSLTFQRSLKIGDEYERRTKLMILRAAMLKAQIQVKSTTIRDGQNEPPGNSNSRLSLNIFKLE